MVAINVKNAAGGTTALFGVMMPDGSTSVAHVLVGADGTPYGAANPLLTAPAIKAIGFTDCSGSITTAGAVALDIAADSSRKGGSIRAASSNTGSILVTLKDGNGGTHAEHLAPGESYALTVNGYVLQCEVSISGDTAGDAFSGVTYA